MSFHCANTDAQISHGRPERPVTITRILGHVRRNAYAIADACNVAMHGPSIRANQLGMFCFIENRETVADSNFK